MLKDWKLLFQSIVYDDSKWLLKDWKLQPFKKKYLLWFLFVILAWSWFRWIIVYDSNIFYCLLFLLQNIKQNELLKDNNFSVVDWYCVTDDGPFAFQLSIDPSMQEYLNQSLGFQLKETLDMSTKNKRIMAYLHFN